MKHSGTFPGALRVEDVNGTRDWKLLKPFVYLDSFRNEIVVPTSFVWNGASVPRFFWRLFGSPFVGRHRKPSVIHDYLWQEALAGRCSFRHANWSFWDGLRSLGVWRVKAWLMWLAVAMNAELRSILRHCRPFTPDQD